MVETNTQTTAVPEAAIGPFADESLKEISWKDLVSRLGAANSLCNVLAQVPAYVRASFEAVASERLSGRCGGQAEDGEHAVNLALSVKSKGLIAIDDTSAASALPAVRGIA